MKIVMPKNSAMPNEIEAVLKIYYEEDSWIENSEYIKRLKVLIGDKQYPSSYTKKAQIPSYFGFLVYEDKGKSKSRKRITTGGKKIYSAILNNDVEKIRETLMESLETITFGRNNDGAPESESDIEPPNLFIRAILGLNYLTYKEFAYLLWKLEDLGENYTDAINELKKIRVLGQLDLGQEAIKYMDCKPITMLLRWGFLEESATINSDFGKPIVINSKVLEKYETRLRNLIIFNVDMNQGDIINNNVSIRKTKGENVILYGVPGSGKSYLIQEEYCNDYSRMERLVFHPDYMNTDFIGQILPTITSEGEISYQFAPGPFTRIIKKAIENPEDMYYLVVEELNRGNAPAIFGEIFQLLDRDTNGNSTYKISNSNIARAVYEDSSKPIFIPSNLSILATMNTSDQNVFTLDTAFQRRWTMRMVENDVSLSTYANQKILDTTVTWETFNKVINKQILGSGSTMHSSEDKRLGAYFITKDILRYYGEKNNDSRFGEKVIKYLWDDVFKFNREKLFKENYKSLEDVVKKFNTSKENERFSIFIEDIESKLINFTGTIIE